MVTSKDKVRSTRATKETINEGVVLMEGLKEQTGIFERESDDYQL
jgi:hypothetical protein